MASLSAIDEARFGIVTAREPQFTLATLQDTLRFCREHSVRMLIARCAAEDLQAAQAMEASGGRLMDTLVYYLRALDRPFPEEEPKVPVRMLRPGEASEVRRVAVGAFRGYFGHYHADPRLDRAKCDEAYASWAERSCLDRSAASKVLVAEHGGRIAGFLTLLERGPEEQEIILNGVDPAFQRHGIYRALVLAAMAHARTDGAKRLSVSTQLINIGVQKTWTRLGFEPSRSYYTFHLWSDDSATAGLA
jgi:GNAT superfamily N-acetyltransferase